MPDEPKKRSSTRTSAAKITVFRIFISIYCPWKIIYIHDKYIHDKYIYIYELYIYHIYYTLYICTVLTKVKNISSDT